MFKINHFICRHRLYQYSNMFLTEILFSLACFRYFSYPQDSIRPLRYLQHKQTLNVGKYNIKAKFVNTRFFWYEVVYMLVTEITLERGNTVLISKYDAKRWDVLWNVNIPTIIKASKQNFLLFYLSDLKHFISVEASKYWFIARLCDSPAGSSVYKHARQSIFYIFQNCILLWLHKNYVKNCVLLFII